MKLRTIIALNVVFLTCVNASFNLFIGVEEVKKLLGLSNELYYVREGVPNIYALQFTVPVPPHVDALHFTWQTLGQKPLPYTAGIEISETVAMLKPSLNISSKGSIPTEAQTFQVYFPCTGAASDEVNFELTLNVTSLTHLRTFNVTTIVLRRRRICLKDAQKAKHLPTLPHPSNHPAANKESSKRKISLEDRKRSENEDENKTGLVFDPEQNDIDVSEMSWMYVLLGAIFGFVLMLIVMGLAALTYFRNKKVIRTADSNGFLNVDTSGNGSSGSSGSASGGSIFTRSDSPHHYSSPSNCLDLYSTSTYYENQQLPFYSQISTDTYKSALSPMSRRRGSYDSKLADVMMIERCKVRLQSIILEGSFSRVYNGTVLENDGSEKKVIVKTVKDGSSPVQMALLLHEGLSLVGMNQQHICTVMGVAAEDRVPPFLIYPDEGLRNLKRFLQRCRSGSGRPILAQEVVHMAIQIGSGLAFLHRQNIIHRDVATRNSLVDEKLMVKISDHALSRDLFLEDYNCLGDSECRPIKWCPPENILQNANLTLASDMWSFGVLLWELFTLAQQPYAQIEVAELNNFLKMGYRLAQPLNCPDEMYWSMSRCWTWEADERPKWSQMLPELQDIYAQLDRYV